MVQSNFIFKILLFDFRIIETMECVKKILIRCKDCCVRRKDSSSSTQIILPTSRKVTSKDGIVNRSTFTYLPQPDFYIPLGDDRHITSSGNHRKQSAPPVLTRTVAIQPLCAYATTDRMHHSLEPQIHVEEDVDVHNQNNNSMSSEERPWRSSESVCSVHSPISPSPRRRQRLSVANIASNHSRRSSMSSFDISRDEVDSDMYESSELSPDLNSNGKICFSVSYDKEVEQLIVAVHCAKTLWHQELNAIAESHVKVSLHPSPTKKMNKIITATQKETANPIFDEKLRINNVPLTSLETIAVNLTIIAVDKSSKKRKLGTVVYKLDASLSRSDEVPEKKIWKHIYGEGMVGSLNRFTVTMQAVSRPTYKVHADSYVLHLGFKNLTTT